MGLQVPRWATRDEGVTSPDVDKWLATTLNPKVDVIAAAWLKVRTAVRYTLRPYAKRALQNSRRPTVRRRVRHVQIL